MIGILEFTIDFCCILFMASPKEVGREHGLEVSDHGMVKCRGQQDDMGNVVKGHLELWHKQIHQTLVKPIGNIPGLVGGCEHEMQCTQLLLW